MRIGGKSEGALACRITAVEQMGYGTGEEGCDKMVEALRVKERGELREDVRCGYG